MGPSATGFAPAWSACHHFDDSSVTAQWTSKSGTATSTVCFAYRAGVPVVAPQFTPLQTGFTPAQTSSLLVLDTLVSRSLRVTFNELTG